MGVRFNGDWSARGLTFYVANKKDSTCIGYPFLDVRESAALKSWTFLEAWSFTCGATDGWTVIVFVVSSL